MIETIERTYLSIRCSCMYPLKIYRYTWIFLLTLHVNYCQQSRNEFMVYRLFRSWNMHIRLWADLVKWHCWTDAEMMLKWHWTASNHIKCISCFAWHFVHKESHKTIENKNRTSEWFISGCYFVKYNVSNELFFSHHIDPIWSLPNCVWNKLGSCTHTAHVHIQTITMSICRMWV